jgi:hypothetical protein
MPATKAHGHCANEARREQGSHKGAWHGSCFESLCRSCEILCLGPAQTTTPRKQRLRIVRRRDGYDHREAKLPLFVAPWRTIRPAKRRQLHTDGSLPLVGGRRHHGHSVSLASSWRRTVFELISQGLKSASFDPQKGHTPFWVCHLGCTKSAGRRLTPASTAAMRPWVRISIG